MASVADLAGQVLRESSGRSGTFVSTLADALLSMIQRHVNALRTARRAKGASSSSEELEAILQGLRALTVPTDLQAQRVVNAEVRAILQKYPQGLEPIYMDACRQRIIRMYMSDHPSCLDARRLDVNIPSLDDFLRSLVRSAFQLASSRNGAFVMADETTKLQATTKIIVESMVFGCRVEMRMAPIHAPVQVQVQVPVPVQEPVQVPTPTSNQAGGEYVADAEAEVVFDWGREGSGRARGSALEGWTQLAAAPIIPPTSGMMGMPDESATALMMAHMALGIAHDDSPVVDIPPPSRSQAYVPSSTSSAQLAPAGGAAGSAARLAPVGSVARLPVAPAEGTAGAGSAARLAPAAPTGSAARLAPAAPAGSAARLAPAAPAGSAARLAPTGSAARLAPAAPAGSAVRLAPAAPAGSAVRLAPAVPAGSVARLAPAAPTGSAARLAPTGSAARLAPAAPAAPNEEFVLELSFDRETVDPFADTNPFTFSS